MELSILQSFSQYGPAVLIMAVMIYWFTKHIDKKDIQNQLNLDKKDTQNQANLDRFIVISEKYSNLTERIAASLDRHIEKIDGHGLKLDQIYEDLKEIKNTHKFLRGNLNEK